MRNKLFLLLALVALCATVRAQEQTQSHWYGGIKGGIPFGVSTFTSFGADKTRTGLSGGIYGGYRFNSIFSLEASAAMGTMGMSADKGCVSYWLGADDNRYLVPVAGMEGWNYSGIYSSVAMRQYGVHLNINVLGFFAATRDSRWTVNLSPALYGVGSKATIKTTGGDQTVLKGDNLWHLGVGGDLMAEYAVTKNLTAGIYTGITYLTGAKMDGMPQYAHKRNMVWESGIRIGWRFGTRAKKAVAPVASTTPVPRETPQQVIKEEPKTAVVEQPSKQDTVQVIKEDVVETVVDAPTVEKTVIAFPTIYFGFNSVAVSDDQTEKLEQILATLRDHPAMQVTIAGWCDSRGTAEVNNRISQLRAEAIKLYLTRNGIASDRIKAMGMGTDTQQPEAYKSRRVETTDKK